jgi:hypothetical protein
MSEETRAILRVISITVSMLGMIFQGATTYFLVIVMLKQAMFRSLTREMRSDVFIMDKILNDKLDAIGIIGNSSLRSQLEINAVNARRIAVLSKLPEDNLIADLAEERLEKLKS